MALDTRDGLVPAIAQALWRQAERALRQGLLQGYRTCDESWRAVRIRPDLVWELGGRPAAVVDAKYKQEKPAGYPDADLYQVLDLARPPAALLAAVGHFVDDLVADATAA